MDSNGTLEIVEQVLRGKNLLECIAGGRKKIMVTQFDLIEKEEFM